MKSKTLAAAVFAAALSSLAAAPAQAAEGAAGLPAVTQLQVRQLSPAVYWVQGGIGNAGFVIGDKGVVVIDTTVSPEGGRLLIAEVAKVTPKPIAAIVLTHGDIDHSGGLAAFPAGIAVIAHQSLKERMDAAAAAGRSRVPADRLPNRVVTQSETVELGGVSLRLLHWAPAHTAGDLVIYVPRDKIAFTGDIFALDNPRALIHNEQNGTSGGWVQTARGILALDAERFVVGHGDVQTKASLQRYTDLSANEIDQIKALVAQGKSLAEVQAAVGDPPPGGPAAPPGGPRFTPLSQVVFQELTEKK